MSTIPAQLCNNPNPSNQFACITFPINFALPGADTGFSITGRPPYDYTWIFQASIAFAFFGAMGIGANDVANSFATSVGAKTLKMWQAVIIAAFCEFFGAYLLGARVTATIRSGIVSPSAFVGHDDVFMFGMFCVLITVTFWLFLATALELPVSTTHTVVGAILGMGLCAPGGASTVKWDEVGKIVGSWFLSPVLAGVVSALAFVLMRKVILRNVNSFERTFLFFPFIVFITVTINVIFILFKGGITKGTGLSAGVTLSDGAAIGISFGVGGALALITLVILGPLLKKSILALSDEQLRTIAVEKGNIILTPEEQEALKMQQQQAQAKASEKTTENDSDAQNTTALAYADSAVDGVEKGVQQIEKTISMAEEVTTKPKKAGQLSTMADKVFRQDYIHNVVDTNERVANIHDNAEAFPIRTEFAFGYLQVFTAMFASFAHGANDVANSIGPLAAVNSVWEEGYIVINSKNTQPVPDWILILGGAGLVVGLAVYGHTIIRAMGVKMVKITPARGFIIELATAFVIIVGSFLGLPLSTTHTTVGAIIGVGVVEGNWRKSVNWGLLGKVFFGWVITLIVAGCTTALIFSFGIFSPSQYYALSQTNCFNKFGILQNNSAVFVYTVQPLNGTITSLIGFPIDGSVGKLVPA